MVIFGLSELINMYSNPLIFGKNPLERITNLEIQDNIVNIFREFPDGSVEHLTFPNKHWILSPRKLTNSHELKGNLYYKYGLQFSNREEFLSARKSLYQQGVQIYSIFDPQESCMVKDGYSYYKGMKVDEISVLSFDIESLTLEHNSKAKAIIIANTFRRNGIVTRKLFCYNDYTTEKDFIDSWCSWVREMNPSLMLGHNINLFDFPYLDFIARRAGTSLKLGRDGSALKFNDKESEFRKDGSQFYTYRKINIFGREVVDTFFLSLKYDIGRKYENYKLKQIINQEGLEVQERQFYDANTIRDNYLIPEEWEKIKRYSVHDGDDALALFDLMAPSQFYFCQSVPKTFQALTESATGSQLNAILMRSYLQNGHSLPKADPANKFEGAISFGIPGLYKNCLKWDVASLYPSIILQYEIYNRKKDPDGNFLKMVRYFTEQRLENKRIAKETGNKYYKDLEQSQKIGINSSYGLLGSQGLLFNDVNNAALVTRKGREILVKAIEWASGKEYNSFRKEYNLDAD